METVKPSPQGVSTPSKPVSTNVQPASNPPVLKKITIFDWRKNIGLFLAVLVVVVLGLATGWLLSGNKALPSQSVENKTTAAQVTTKSATEAGLKEEKGDMAEGVLTEGGISGEGTHHLVRDGGPARYVYLNSTIVDLGSFVGKKVQVWGNTASSKKAGWLMDVNRLKVTE